MKQYLLSVHYVEGQQPRARDVMAKIYKDVNTLNDELRATDTWVFGGGLHTPDVATVVLAQDGEVLTTDGPFAESKEHIGGFWVIKAPDLDAALAWAAKASTACAGPVEVRPFQEEAAD
jgi:hypothetical protein